MKTVAIDSSVQDKYHHILERIVQAGTSAGRNPDSVRLVVVTKGHPAEAIQDVLAAGARDLGENYVEEAVPKILACSEHKQVTWHMIGHVQRRKARLVCEHFDFLHSLDSLKLANRLDRFAGESGRRLPVLLECNVSGEETKTGFQASVETDWPGLLPEINQILALPNLKVGGLMTMAPFVEDPEDVRPCFSRLRRLKEFLSERFPEAEWGELSMGMSADFVVAIQEGATLVRIGTAIMGPRPVREVV